VTAPRTAARKAARSVQPAQPPGRPGEGLPLYPQARSDVRAALDAHCLILIIGRDSSGDLKAAVKNLLGAARHLAEQERVHVTHLLPTDEELVAHHRVHKIVDDSDLEYGTGEPIRHEYSLWTAPGLVLLITLGSGSKVEQSTFSQPAIVRTARIIHEYEPTITYAREIERVGREGFGPIVVVLRHLDAKRPNGFFLGYSTQTLSVMDDALEQRLGRDTVVARQEVKTLRGRGADGGRADLGRPYVNAATYSPASDTVRDATSPLPGMWVWTSAYVPPPGLVVGRLKTLGRGRPPLIASVDSPRYRPDPACVLEGFPQTLRPDEQPADQLATIRWLGDILRPGIKPSQVAAALVQRGWTTPGMQRRHWGQPVVMQLQADRGEGKRVARTNLQKMLLTFLRYLDFYATGTLSAPLGIEDRHASLTGVLPPDGQPWLTETQLKGIRRWMAGRRQAAGPRDRFMFSGLPCTVDSNAALLWADSKGDATDPHYYPRRPLTYRTLDTARKAPLPPLPGTVLAEWFLDTLCGLARPWSMTLVDHAAEAVPGPAESELTAVRAQIKTMKTQQERRWLQIDPAVVTVTTPTVRRVQKEYDQEQPHLDGLEAKANQLEARAKRERAPAHQGLPLESLAADAARIPGARDSHGVRGRLRSAVESFDITYDKRISHGGKPAYDITGTLTLLISDGSDGSDEYRTTSVHTYVGGAVRRVPGALGRAIDGLYDGINLDQSLPEWPKWTPALLAALGGARFLLGHVDDPRLLRLIMRVVYPPRPIAVDEPDPETIVRRTDPPVSPADLPRLARRLGEPVALLRAIHAAHVDPPSDRTGRWLHETRAGVDALFALAAVQGGVVLRADLPEPTWRRSWTNLLSCHRTREEWKAAAPGVLHLRPCRQCGGSRRAVLRLREATGSVCLDCRTDRTGVPWEPSYDRYR
jgi:hypothetical protein